MPKNLTGWLTGKPLITPAEREEALAYYQRSLRITGLQEREADRYNNSLLLHMNSLDTPVSAKVMVESSKRLAMSAKECIRRHANLSPVPHFAATHYAAWGLVYQRYSTWSDAQHQAFVAIANGSMNVGSFVALARDLMAASEHARQKAEKEAAKFLKALGLKVEEVQRLISAGAQAKETSDWEPAEPNPDR